MRRDVRPAVATVDFRLEDLDLPLGDLRAPQAADQLLALAAEHAPRNDFQPARTRAMCNVHLSLLQILAGLGLDADHVADVDERRHLDDQPGLERGRLDLRARRGAVDPWNSIDDLEI